MAQKSAVLGPKSTRRLRHKRDTDFSKIGGLDCQIQTIREIIVVPLLYQDLYFNFNVKPPKGVLFYGPPGTGKTLVAGALAQELSKEGLGKVQFFNRKGTDILDKFYGESERKLRDVFEKATKARPSVIFFDEIDGLAPARTKKHDMHCSVVAMLLTLMDGLNSTPGVVVIGATNRLEAIDPALRRPGRFDRELYFGLPCTIAREEILKVHTQSWLYKPNPEFMSDLAELTAGFTGADLHALCSEAFLCCIKRLYPNIQQKSTGNKININHNHVKVEECDFLTAKLNISPSMERAPSKMMKLAPYVQPLLQRQLNRVVHQIHRIWPHFTDPGFKFVKDSELYMGSILLIGSNKQGLHNHFVPALLHALEHLPVVVVDSNIVLEKTVPHHQSIPHILLLSRVHDWWNVLDEAYRGTLISLLEDTHPSTPTLIICSSNQKIPETLLPYFAENSSIIVQIENPNAKERESFFKPLFFSTTGFSMETILKNFRTPKLANIKREYPEGLNTDNTSQRSTYNTSQQKIRLRGGTGGRKRLNSTSKYNFYSSIPLAKRNRSRVRYFENSSNTSTASSDLYYRSSCEQSSETTYEPNNTSTGSVEKLFEDDRYPCKVRNLHNIKMPLTNLVNSIDQFPVENKVKKEYSTMNASDNEDVHGYGDVTNGDAERTVIKNLFNRVMKLTTDDWTQRNLELMYRTMVTCMEMNKNDFEQLVQNMTGVLINFESL